MPDTLLAEDIMEETLINFGGEIKSVEETETGYKFGGWLVVFDKPDVSNMRDHFTKSTDFDIEDGDRRSVYYNHGLDGTIKKTKLGDCRLAVKDAGVWIEGEIKKRSDYLAKHAQHIAENIKQFGLSSGAPAHLVERVKVANGHEVKMWPLAEASITPTPAEPLTSCLSLKSLLEVEEEAGVNELDAMKKFDPNQPRDDDGKFTSGASSSAPSADKSPLMQNVGKSKELRGKIKANLDAVEKAPPGSPQHLELLSKAATLHEEHAQVLTDIADHLEKSATARKSDDETEDDFHDTPEYKQLTELSDGLRDGLSFQEYSVKVRDALADVVTHIEAFEDVRCVKSNRRWSAEKYELLTGLADDLSQKSEAIKAIAFAHAPREVARLQSDLTDAEIRFAELLMDVDLAPAVID